MIEEMEGFTYFMQFKKSYKCFSVSKSKRNYSKDISKGNNIIMPPSALYELSHSAVDFPLVFKIFNRSKSKSTHCGVLEFVAEEGKVYLPDWMMENLGVKNGELIKMRNTTLPSGNFVQFQPLSEDFLDISNPRAVLETKLRNYTCLTTGDIVNIDYNNKIYKLRVLQTKPTDAVKIIDCDVSVEFIWPKNQEESIPQEPKIANEEIIYPSTKFVPFQGEGVRLDGKPIKEEYKAQNCTPKQEVVRGIPDNDFQFGTLKFIR